MFDKVSVVEEIIEQWEIDAAIDPTDIKGESIRTPILHAKYVRMLAVWKIKQTNLKIKLNEVRQEKTRYYNGDSGNKMSMNCGVNQSKTWA